MNYQLDFDVGVLGWILEECHGDAQARERVRKKLYQALRLVSEHGASVGPPHAKKIKGHENLYEIRIEDETGWYRVFFGFGPARKGKPTLVALAYALVKHERSLPDHIYAEAAAAVTAHLSEQET